MALALNIGKCTLLGNYRENNEDSIDVKSFPDMTVCLVADGMGGQAAGEVASKRAIEIVPRELKNMGTTIVLSLWRKGSALLYVAGMGDSRAYLLRGRRIEQLTVDHSIA